MKGGENVDTFAKFLALVTKYVVPVVNLIQEISADVKGVDENAQK